MLASATDTTQAKPERGPAALRKHFSRRLAALKTERASWESHWRDLSTYILPRRGRYLTTDKDRGEKINSAIIDNTATLAARTLSSGMMAGVTSPARPWFRLTPPNPEMGERGPVKAWLHVVETRMREVFARSNIYNILNAAYDELGVFGTAAICVEEDHEDVIRGYAYTAGEFLIGTSSRGVVDCLYRECQLTVGQLVERFGRDSCSPIVQSAFDGGRLDQAIDVVHAVERNVNRDISRADAGNKPWLSAWYEKAGAADGKLLKVSGYDEFPIMAPRWHVTATDAYGRSPAMDCLGDVKQLQIQQRRKAQAIDKLVNPPLVAAGTMKTIGVTVLPGGVNFNDGVNGAGEVMRPVYQVNPQVQHLVADIEDTRQRIRRGLFEDLFLMMARSDRREITAREVDERHEEKLLALGPVLERLHDELLDPLIDRTFAIMVRARLIPPPPVELQGTDLKVEYVSMLAMAQKAIATAGIERLAGFVGNLAAANPEVLDKVDFDQTVDEYAQMLGVPPQLVRADDAVAEMREQRRKAQAEQAAMANAGAMVQGAKTLSETDTSRDSALSRVLGLAA